MEKNRRVVAREHRQHQQKIRTTIFAVIIIGVLGLSGYYLKTAFFKPAPPPMAGNVIDITGAMDGFDQKEIHVKVGQPVTVRLTSLDNSHHTDGGGKHQWAVDDLNVSIIAPPEGSEYATFTPTKPGTYVYYCDICCGGRANPTMNGTLIVES
jgi:heme/copper-type cytochrome/quinol oxidase subunit 2